MTDIDRAVHERTKGLYVYFGCLACGRKSLLGNLAQRIREGHMPACHGKPMQLVRAEDRALQAALKAKRGEGLAPEELRALEGFMLDRGAA